MVIEKYKYEYIRGAFKKFFSVSHNFIVTVLH